MFTGLVEAVAHIVDIKLSGSVNELVTEKPSVFTDVKLGDSIAINGVCLTISKMVSAKLVFDVMPETLRKTNLHRLTRGSLVNLERALALGSRLGGHLVTGHIDGVGQIIDRRPEGNAVLFTVSAPNQVRDYLVKKGSVAIDGISLTIGEVNSDGFWVSIIPHTLAATALRYRQPGDLVNLEADAIGKYVFEHLELRQSHTKGITIDYLRQHGF